MKNVIRIIKNFFWCLQYPFLRYRDSTGKKSGFKYTVLDDLGYGWYKAFGRQMCKDLKAALKVDGILKEFYFIQVKEKYGGLRLYSNITGPKTDGVIFYYEQLSYAYCINCGKPVRYISSGYLVYLCEDCAEITCAKTRRLDAQDIPSFSSSSQYIQAAIDKLDFKKFWNIE